MSARRYNGWICIVVCVWCIMSPAYGEEPAKPVPPAVAGPDATTSSVENSASEQPKNSNADGPPASESTPARLPLPDAASLDAALQQLKDIFKDDYANLYKSKDKTALAQKLIRQTGQPAGDVAGCYVMLREALRLAIDAGDTQTLERAVTALATNYVGVDEFDTLAESWNELLRKLRPPSVNKAVAEAILAAVDRAVADEKFDAAIRLNKLAIDASRRSKDATLARRASDRDESLAAKKQESDALRAAAGTLKEKPDDPAANLAMGRHLCFAAGDWERGLPMLTKGNDEVLKDLARRSLTNPAATSAQIELADAWWKAAEAAEGDSKAELRMGACYWYDIALPLANGLARAKIEQRLALAGPRIKDRTAALDVPPTDEPAGKPMVKAAIPAVAPFDAKQAKQYQTAWAQLLDAAANKKNALGMAFALIPPGAFLMGSADSAAVASEGGEIPTAERPQHRVILTKPFLMGSTEVTIGEFSKFVEGAKYLTDAERFGGGNLDRKIPEADASPNKMKSTWRSPGYAVTERSAVAQVSWNDAVAFANWFSQKDKLTLCYRQDPNGEWVPVPQGTGYRLPTEAEWEYACRAGTATAYSFGDDAVQLTQYAWYRSNTSGELGRVVGLKLPNPFGLYDMHGNLWEWCQDCCADYGNETLRDPTGPASGSARGVRGGSYYDSSTYCRSAYRQGHVPIARHRNLGFRVVRVLDVKRARN